MDMSPYCGFCREVWKDLTSRFRLVVQPTWATAGLLTVQLLVWCDKSKWHVNFQRADMVRGSGMVGL